VAAIQTSLVATGVPVLRSAAWMAAHSDRASDEAGGPAVELDGADVLTAADYRVEQRVDRHAGAHHRELVEDVQERYRSA
jgi:hypothetical protein